MAPAAITVDDPWHLTCLLLQWDELYQWIVLSQSQIRNFFKFSKSRSSPEIWPLYSVTC